MCAANYSNNSIKFTDGQHSTLILEKLQILRDQQRCCDVIVDVAGEQFEVHRCVLAACSPYFDSMFKDRGTRNFKEHYKIHCQEPEVFHSVLNYMYTGVIVINSENASELLQLSNRLLLDTLTKYCADFLKEYLNISNCLTIKELADKYQLEALSEESKSFIRSCLGDIIEEEEILNYSLQKLEDFIKCSDWRLLDLIILKLVSSWVLHNLEERVTKLRILLTWVSWKCLTMDEILDILKNHRLYSCSNLAVFFLLDILKEHSLLPNELLQNHAVLEEKFCSTTRQTIEGFMNLAVETALGKKPDEEETRDDETSNSISVPFPPTQFSTYSSIISNENDHKQRIQNDNYMKPWLSKSDGIVDNIKLNRNSSLENENANSKVENIKGQSPYNSIRLDNSIRDLSLNSRFLLKDNCSKEDSYQSNIATDLLHKDDNFVDSMDDSCSHESNQKYIKHEHFISSRTSSIIPDQSVIDGSNKVYHNAIPKTKGIPYVTDSNSAFIVNSLQYEQPSTNYTSSTSLRPITYLDSGLENNRNFEITNDPVDFHFSLNNSNVIQNNCPRVFFSPDNYYLNDSSGSEIQSQNHIYVNENSCDTQTSNCPQDMTMHQSQKKELLQPVPDGSNEFCNGNNKTVWNTRSDDKTNEIHTFRRVEDFQLEENESWINPSTSQTDEERRSPVNVHKLLETLPGITNEDYQNLNMQKTFNFDQLENNCKQGQHINILHRNIEPNLPFEMNTKYRYNSNLSDYDQSSESNDLHKLVIEEPNKSQENSYFIPMRFNEVVPEPNTMEPSYESSQQQTNNSTNMEDTNTKSQIPLNEVAIKSADVTTHPTDPEHIPRHVKFRIIKDIKNIEKCQNEPKINSLIAQQEQVNIVKEKEVENKVIINSELNPSTSSSNDPSTVNKNKNKVNTSEKTHVCNICNTTFVKNKEYFSHMKLHFPGPPFKCDQCVKSFKTIYHLLDHRITHQNIKAHLCPHPECNFSSHKKFNLTEHMKKHTSERTFICKICNAGFYRAQALTTHMTKHTNDRPFVCESCGWTGKTKSLLRVHMKIHTGDMYSCQYPNCAYRTAKISHLKDHMQIHCYSGPYKCQKCSKHFRSNSHYYRHLRSHFEHKLHCSHCNYTCYRTDRLSMHIKSKHTTKDTVKPRARKHQLKKKDAMLSYSMNKSPKPKTTKVEIYPEIENTNVSLQPQFTGSPPPTTLSEYSTTPVYVFNEKEENVDDPLNIQDVPESLSDGTLFHRNFSQCLDATNNSLSPAYNNGQTQFNTLELWTSPSDPIT